LSDLGPRSGLWVFWKPPGEVSASGVAYLDGMPVLLAERSHRIHADFAASGEDEYCLPDVPHILCQRWVKLGFVPVPRLPVIHVRVPDRAVPFSGH